MKFYTAMPHIYGSKVIFVCEPCADTLDRGGQFWSHAESKYPHPDDSCDHCGRPVTPQPHQLDWIDLLAKT